MTKQTAILPTLVASLLSAPLTAQPPERAAVPAGPYLDAVAAAALAEDSAPPPGGEPPPGAGAGPRFEEAAAAAGLDFRYTFGDYAYDNILESSGSARRGTGSVSSSLAGVRGRPTGRAWSSKRGDGASSVCTSPTPGTSRPTIRGCISASGRPAGSSG